MGCLDGLKPVLHLHANSASCRTGFSPSLIERADGALKKVAWDFEK